MLMYANFKTESGTKTESRLKLENTVLKLF